MKIHMGDAEWAAVTSTQNSDAHEVSAYGTKDGEVVSFYLPTASLRGFAKDLDYYINKRIDRKQKKKK